MPQPQPWPTVASPFLRAHGLTSSRRGVPMRSKHNQPKCLPNCIPTSRRPSSMPHPTNPDMPGPDGYAVHGKTSSAARPCKLSRPRGTSDVAAVVNGAAMRRVFARVHPLPYPPAAESSRSLRFRPLLCPPPPRFPRRRAHRACVHLVVASDEQDRVVGRRWFALLKPTLGDARRHRL